MSDFTIVKLEEVPDPSGDYPGEMRMFTGPLATEQVAFTYRRMPPQTGGMKGLRWGHSHKTQEEIYFVLSGTLHVKVADDEFDLGPGQALRLSPDCVRAVWNDGDDGRRAGHVLAEGRGSARRGGDPSGLLAGLIPAAA